MLKFDYRECSRETEIHVSSEEENQEQNGHTERRASPEGSGNGNLKERKLLWGCIAFLSFSVTAMVMFFLLDKFVSKGVVDEGGKYLYLGFLASLLVASIISSVWEEAISRRCWLKAAIVIVVLILAVLSLAILASNISEDGLNASAFIVIVISSFFVAIASRLCFLCWKAESTKDARVHAVDIMTIASVVGILLTVTTLLLNL